MKWRPTNCEKHFVSHLIDHNAIKRDIHEWSAGFTMSKNYFFSIMPWALFGRGTVWTVQIKVVYDFEELNTGHF